MQIESLNNGLGVYFRELVEYGGSPSLRLV